MALASAAMNVPDDRRYSKDHEWALLDGGRVRIGVTEYAQDALGDVVFVQLPAVGTVVEAGAAFSEVESTKSVSDVYAPVAGVVAAVNELLDSAPETVNADPYGEGWLVEISVPGEGGDPIGQLLDADAYQALVDGS